MNLHYVHKNWKDEVAMQRALVGPFIPAPEEVKMEEPVLETREQLYDKIEGLQKKVETLELDKRKLDRMLSSLRSEVSSNPIEDEVDDGGSDVEFNDDLGEVQLKSDTKPTVKDSSKRKKDDNTKPTVQVKRKKEDSKSSEKKKEDFTDFDVEELPTKKKKKKSNSRTTKKNNPQKDISGSDSDDRPIAQQRGRRRISG